MTDMIYALSVVLEKDTRSDDILPIIEAIKMIRGVRSVGVSVGVNVSDISQWTTGEYWQSELARRLSAARRGLARRG